MRGFVALLLVASALSACSGSGTLPLTAAKTPSAQTLQPPASPNASPSPSMSPSPDLPISGVAFSCRLPVLVTSQYSDSASLKGGFITFPGAAFQEDSNGVILPQPTGLTISTAAPLLHGVPETGLPFYDLAMKRWLPVGSGQTSPDGKSYAYSVPGPNAVGSAAIHVVQVATGGDRIITLGPPPQGQAVGWQVADYDGKSVYLVGQQIDQSPGGVWRLDIATGSLHLLTPARHVQLVQNGTAWIAFDNPADPSPPNPGKGEAFDSVAAVNLATGAQTTWVYKPGLGVSVLAVDEFGRLVAGISDFTPGSEGVVDYQAPGDAGNAIFSASSIPYAGVIQPDLGRLWFGTDRGIYFWTATSGYVKLYDFHGDPTTLSQTIAPAGHCV